MDIFLDVVQVILNIIMIFLLLKLMKQDKE